MALVQGRDDGHALPRGEAAVDIGAQLGDRAGHFVAEGDGQLGARVRVALAWLRREDGPVEPFVEVGAADSAAGEVDADVVGAACAVVV